MKKILLISCLLFTIIQAQAQYKYSNQSALSINGGIKSHNGFVAGVTFSRVFKLSMSSVDISANYEQSQLVVNNTHKVRSSLFLGKVYYQYSFDRLFSSQWFHLNIGTGFDFGYESITKPSDPLIYINKDNSFVYGFGFTLTPEFKVSSVCSIILRPQYTYLFRSLINSNISFLAGIKFYL